MHKLRYTESLPNYMQGLTNIKRATNMQYDWLYSHGCFHRHSYSRHFNCFLKDFDIKERIGFLDIETSNLKANFGIVLSWCILDENGKTLLKDYIKKADVESGGEDDRLIYTCISAMELYDRIVTHYGTYFDIPFLRTRALIHKLDFPERGTLYHTDVWKWARKTLCLHSNRQDVIAESLYGKTEKTRISHPAWRKAMMGDEKAALEVLDHNEHDVFDLRKNYLTLLPYNNNTRTSI